MELPPGITYLLEVFPRFAIPSIIAYLSLYLLEKREPSFSIPSWAAIILAIFTRPIILIFNHYHSIWVNKRAAAANNAVLAPSLPKSPLTIVSEFAWNSRHGHPGVAILLLFTPYQPAICLILLTKVLAISHIPPQAINIKLKMAEGSVFFSQAHSLLGEGVFNSDGEMWKFHRAMTRPFFTRERITDFDIYDRNWNISLQIAKDRLSEGFSLDIQDLISRFTLDSATEFLFGGAVGSLSAGIPYPPAHKERNSSLFYNHPSTSFVKAFTEGLWLVAERSNLGKEWSLWEFNRDKITPLRRIIDDFTEPLLRKALDTHANDMNSEASLKHKDEVTLLEHLVKHTRDTKFLKDELVNLLVAGRDTTMCLLTYAIYMLAEHPGIEKRLREEIFAKVGPTEAPKYEQMREMRYVKAFLNEVLRLYPPVPSNGRITTKPVLLPAVHPGGKPIYVPKDTSCIYPVINIHRRTDLWGPDALEFDPDRFLDERVQKYLVPNPFIFCPFNAGPRICLGQQFAYNEATFYLVRLLQNFTEFTLDNSVNVPPPEEWKSEGGRKAKEKVHPTSHLTLFVKGGLWIRMKEFSTSEI
ncbi:hypothetical protein CVT25_002479 [Psilocybe cyanescens]|uniref:Cytochrome P450 n=1 Tax=Psilocybe cyanescens TaxID=93625 RepID=A0A409X4N2_PSICY|nr:hypothetical protein CVT25_002479 [Psilocybe cyanescens]